MDLEGLYFISQVVAAFAIVGSLIFVGLQARAGARQAKRNEETRRAAAAEAVHQNFSNYYALAANPEIGRVLLKGLDDIDALSPEENVTFMTGNMVLMSNLQSAFLKWQDGELSEDLWHSWRMAGVSIFATAGGKEFWSRRRYIFTGSFVEYVESELLNQELPAGAWAWDRKEIVREEVIEPDPEESLET